MKIELKNIGLSNSETVNDVQKIYDTIYLSQLPLFYDIIGLWRKFGFSF